MENIRISVIIPVYGVETFIERCVRSLFEQTMTEGVEFIFVNDCTEDRSIDLLTDLINEYPHLTARVKILHHLHNRGLAAARKTGLEAARGEYIMHVDSDDFFEHDMLEVMYEAAVAKDADVVVSDFFMSFKNGEEYHKCPLYDSKDIMFRSMIAPWKYGNKSIGQCVWNKLTKRSIYTDHNIRFVEGIDHGEDFIVVSQILYYADIVTKVDRAFAHYNKQNSGSYTRDMSASNTRQRMKATEIVADFLSKKDCVFDDELDEKRFREKLLAIANCDMSVLPEFLAMYPWLDYEKHKHLVARYWRLPYKFALQGRTGMFVFLRGLIVPLRKIYQSIHVR